jgi:hypothetical protein
MIVTMTGNGSRKAALQLRESRVYKADIWSFKRTQHLKKPVKSWKKIRDFPQRGRTNMDVRKLKIDPDFIRYQPEV